MSLNRTSFPDGSNAAIMNERAIVSHERQMVRVRLLKEGAAAKRPEWMSEYEYEREVYGDGSAVYFILSTKLRRVKIGFAKDRWQRFADIQQHNADSLDLIGYLAGGRSRTEGALHRLFAKEHVRGEWFYYTQRIMDFVFAFCTDGDEDF